MDTNPMHGGFSSGINQYYLLGDATTCDLCWFMLPQRKLVRD